MLYPLFLPSSRDERYLFGLNLIFLLLQMHQMKFGKKQVHISTSTVSTYSKNVIFFQLMATGENGASGAHVRRRASKENNQEHVNVIHQLKNMEERNVTERGRKLRFATKWFHVQVRCDLQFVCFVASLR